MLGIVASNIATDTVDLVRTRQLGKLVQAAERGWIKQRQGSFEADGATSSASNNCDSISQVSIFRLG